MSSSTPHRRDRLLTRLPALVVAVCAVQWLLAGTAWAVPLSVIAVLPPTNRSVPLVVDVGAFAQPRSVSATVRGVPQPTTVVPVMSDRLAVSIVVDASVDGGQALPAWLSGAARFVLDAPTSTRSAVVADTTPPVPVAPLTSGALHTVRALDTVRAHGQRRTAAALGLAVGQLPGSVDGPRVVVLYTTAPDAGGPAAGDLAARLLKAHALLVVVSTATDADYWWTVARATGGFRAPALAGSVVPALDQVDTVLRARYLVSIPTPARLPASVSVRVDTGQVVLTADAVVPLAAAERPSGPEPPLTVAAALLRPAAIGVLVVAVMAVVVAIVRRRQVG
jgi:hypothetical protein